mmetsp:Transcript_26253/g.77020  ORF Transcript_26253/g.77020 Transcript_26253/m.77020 type:complete len:209 (+) Transcript_26253:320-946(+)
MEGSSGAWGQGQPAERGKVIRRLRGGIKEGVGGAGRLNAAERIAAVWGRHRGVDVPRPGAHIQAAKAKGISGSLRSLRSGMGRWPLAFPPHGLAALAVLGRSAQLHHGLGCARWRRPPNVDRDGASAIAAEGVTACTPRGLIVAEEVGWGPGRLRLRVGLRLRLWHGPAPRWGGRGIPFPEVAQEFRSLGAHFPPDIPLLLVVQHKVL